MVVYPMKNGDLSGKNGDFPMKNGGLSGKHRKPSLKRPLK